MNTSNIKSYAPKARKAFIDAVSKQAAKFGITAEHITTADIKGDLVLIGGRAFPVAILHSRNALVQLIEQHGFAQMMDKVAYSWFNRLCAIRYMELHDYLDHGRRVLSHPEHATGYQLLDECLDVELPGLDKALVRELKLDGTKDESLYRELLLAQCHALHNAMPFLFERVDDATELLLPVNLIKTDSLIHDLVISIPEEDWNNIEVIGWLYQSYISERKGEVIGKVVKSDDIPAATQLFTPNWIVRYMVQNSLGAQWLATYTESPLKGQMEYYIEPAEQTGDVDAELSAITPSQLNPEDLTLIDPASGSGHILVEAYELLKAIYLERGYRQRDIPQLILEKNLFGLDIDERAAQLTSFALMMKGRADDRRLFERGVKLNVMALVDSAGFDAESLVNGIELSGFGLTPGDLTGLKQLFEDAMTFGSLIKVPEELASSLPALKKLSEATSQDLFVSEAFKELRPLVQQAELLAKEYDAVVANPPYLDTKNMTPQMKSFLRANFGVARKDMFAAFILRAMEWAPAKTSTVALVTPFSWMCLSSYESLREYMLTNATINCLIELEANAFEPAMVTVCSFVLSVRDIAKHKGSYIRLSQFKGARNQAPKTLEAIKNPGCGWFYQAVSREFTKLPGIPMAYWVPAPAIEAFMSFPRVNSLAEAKQGLITGDNDRFLRLWYEVSSAHFAVDCATGEDARLSGKTWFPFQKGGAFRKWFGNHHYVVNWRDDGRDLRSFVDKNGKLRSRPQSIGYYFKPAITWTSVTISTFNCRLAPSGFIYSEPGPLLYTPNFGDLHSLAACMNSKSVNYLLQLVAPAMHYNQGHLAELPFPELSDTVHGAIQDAVVALTKLSKEDWDAYERSWEFQSFPLLTNSSDPTDTLESNYSAWLVDNREKIIEMTRLEEEINSIFNDAYGLADELTSDVSIEQVTLTVNPDYRYGGNITDEEKWIRFREDSMQELVSYAVGCTMGRYSLDVPGILYSHGSNEGFDRSKYISFQADDDGIVPLTDKEWFDDDAANRLVDFMSVAWDKQNLEQNLDFLADNLMPKKGEDSRDTIRRYLNNSFYKDHLHTYKKRPIYWLFSSGKQKAFQCLVYLHRYNEGTLARMRTEYVIPLTAKLATYAEKLDRDIEASGSAAEVKRLEKEKTQLHKQQAELSEFDEKLRHYADQRISLDLDDGVKVNYGKFGDLLVEVKAITGKAPEKI